MSTVIESPVDITTAANNLYEEDVHRTYSVIYRNGDVINSTAEELAAAIRSVKKQNPALLKKQFFNLLERLKQWCLENPKELNEAFIIKTPGAVGKFLFVAMQKDNKWNTDFAQSLTDLEIEIEDSNEFNLISLQVMELPKLSQLSEKTIQSVLRTATGTI